MLYLTPVDENMVSYELEKGKAPDIPPCVLRERGSYEIEYTGDGWPELFLSGAKMERAYVEVHAERSTIRWHIDIEEHAGLVLLELADRERVGSWELDVAPHPGKLGRDVYYEMLEDLNSKCEGIVIETGHGSACLEEQGSNGPLLTVFLSLKTYFSALERAFSAIKCDPQKILIAERNMKKISQARCADRRTLLYVTGKPDILSALKPGRSTYSTPDSDPLIDLPRKNQTYDTPANRYVLEVLNRITRVSDNIKKGILSYIKGNSDPIIKSRLNRWAEETDVFLGRASIMKKAFFLKGVDPSPPDTAAMMTIKGHPVYSRFETISRKILNPLANLGSDLSRANLRSTWQVYEYWVFFRLAFLIKKAFPHLSWTSLSINQSGIICVLPDGIKLRGRGEGIEIELTYQRKFNSIREGVEVNGFGSISKMLIPDYLLKIKTKSFEKILILDAKYRTSRDSINEALRDIHVYRDAIRESLSLSGAAGAYIITPGCKDDLIYFKDSYRERYKFGGFIFTLGDGDQSDDFLWMINQIAEEK